MESSDFDRLLALIQAHTLAICSLIATHPQPDRLRITFATLVENSESKFDTECWLIYQSALGTFQKAIPPH